MVGLPLGKQNAVIVILIVIVIVIVTVSVIVRCGGITVSKAKSCLTPGAERKMGNR